MKIIIISLLLLLAISVYRVGVPAYVEFTTDTIKSTDTWKSTETYKVNKSTEVE